MKLGIFTHFMRAVFLASVLFAIAGMPSSLHAQNGFKIMFNFGLGHGDYKDFDLAQPVWESCRDACAAESACLAFTYTIPVAGPNGRPAHCWLKNVVNAGEGRDWCISGIKQGAAGCGNGDYGVQAPSQVKSGTRFNVQLSTRGPKPTGHTDWVAIFVAGTKEYREWYWVGDISGCDVSFNAPAPGTYEIRYILAGDDWPIASRTTLYVQ